MQLQESKRVCSMGWTRTRVAETLTVTARGGCGTSPGSGKGSEYYQLAARLAWYTQISGVGAGIIAGRLGPPGPPGPP